MRRYRTLIFLLLALAAGCTALRLGYTQADVILGWRANSYFDLDADQRRDFAGRLDRLLAWHRYEQLPEYATFLTTAIDKAEHGVTAEDIDWFVDGFKARYRIIINRGANDAAEILATLEPAQITALQKQFNKDNKKFANEHELGENGEKRKRERLKRTLSQLEYWTGNLSREQEGKIAAMLAPIPLIEHLRHEDRMRRQREFVELLKLRKTGPEFATLLREWLLEWDHGRAPEYARLSEEVYHQRVKFYLAVDKLITREQRQHALSRLKKYAEDCKSLSSKNTAHADERGAVIDLFALL
jgi:hypothetical protein